MRSPQNSFLSCESSGRSRRRSTSSVPLRYGEESLSPHASFIIFMFGPRAYLPNPYANPRPPPTRLYWETDDGDWSREPIRYPDTLIRSMFLRRPQTLAFFLRNPPASYLHFQGRCLAAYVSLGAADAQQALPYSLSPLRVALGADEFAPEAERGCVSCGRRMRN